jgi:hypothetical protein
MPQSIPKPTDDAAAGSNGHKHPSLDFHGQRELDWTKIEMEIHCIFLRARAMEMIRRTAQDAVHGEDLTDVFGMLTEHLYGDIERLKELLGIGRSGPEEGAP